MSKIKDKIDNILQLYGSDVTHRTNTPGADDTWGNPTVSSFSDATIKAVKDNNFIKQITMLSAGRFESGNASLIIKADVTIDTATDKVVYGGQTYNVSQVEALELSGELLAQIIEIGLDSSS